MFNSPPWPPQLDAAATTFYNNLHIQKYPNGIDALGLARWCSDWRVHMANGFSEQDAQTVIFTAIDDIRRGVEPVQQPLGEYSVPWPPSLDVDAPIFVQHLVDLYKKEQDRPVDALGYVRWPSDYRIHRANGMSHEDAERRVFNEIRIIWGIPIEQPPPVGNASPLVGLVELIDGGHHGIRDVTGPRLIVGLHAGDLLARAKHFGWEPVLAALDYAADRGFHFVRTWTVLPGEWWATSPRPGNIVPEMPDYWPIVHRFCDELNKRNLRWLVSQGDMARHYGESSKRKEFMRNLAQTLKDKGGNTLVFGVDGGNEAWQNGESDENRLAEIVNAFIEVLPTKLVSLTSVPEEGVLNDYSIPPATITDYHLSRMEFRHAIERCFTTSYWDGKILPFEIDSEPPGPGKYVSATNHPEQWLEMEVMGTLALVHLMTRQVPVAFSSPGVISDEPFTNYPQLDLFPKAVTVLPSTIQSWDLFHGGEGRSFSADRILAVSGNNVRCDHARNGNDYACLVYQDDPGPLHLYAVNGFEGRIINPADMSSEPISFGKGQTVTLNFRRARLLLGKRTT